MRKNERQPGAAKKSAARRPRRRVLVIDIGGTHVKILVTGQSVHRQFDSGPTLTPRQLVAEVRQRPPIGLMMSFPSAIPDPCCTTGQRKSRGISAEGGCASITRPPSNAP